MKTNVKQTPAHTIQSATGKEAPHKVPHIINNTDIQMNTVYRKPIYTPK